MLISVGIVDLTLITAGVMIIFGQITKMGIVLLFVIKAEMLCLLELKQKDTDLTNESEHLQHLRRKL